MVAQAVRVLEVVAAKAAGDFHFNLETFLIGGAAIDATGNPLPDATLQAAKSADAILMGMIIPKRGSDSDFLAGSVGGPKWGVGKVRPEQGLLRLRKELGLYANIRPANFASESLITHSPLKESVAKGVDFIVIRELIGGLYFGDRKEQNDEPKPDAAWDTMIYSVPEVQRITRVAAQIAMNANPPLAVHSIDKANVLASSRLWRKVVTDTLEKEYPQLSLDHHLVDSAAMVIVSNPKRLNGVILTENMFGDMYAM